MEKKGVEINETEQQLKKLYDETEIRDFSAVWEDIKDKIEQPIKEPKKNRWWVYLSAVASVVVVVISCIFLFSFLKNRNTVYFEDELIKEIVTEEEFFDSISSNVVDISKYISDGYAIYKAKNDVVKGGYVNIVDKENSPTLTISLEFYDDNVEVSSKETIEYDKNADINGAKIKYKLTASYPEYSFYTYDIEANYNSVNYYMTCTCTLTDPTPFFTEFFS